MGYGIRDNGIRDTGYGIRDTGYGIRDQAEARRLLTEQFATFDAGKAQCFLAKDREHLLAVIEASFGDFYDFNRLARNLLTSRVRNALSSRAPSRRNSIESLPGTNIMSQWTTSTSLAERSLDGCCVLDY